MCSRGWSRRVREHMKQKSQSHSCSLGQTLCLSLTPRQIFLVTNSDNYLSQSKSSCWNCVQVTSLWAQGISWQSWQQRSWPLQATLWP